MKQHEAMFNKICLNQNGDAKIYTPSGIFIISALKPLTNLFLNP